MGPEYVPPAVVWLCTNAAASINSQIIGASGGNIELYSQWPVKRAVFKDPSKGPWTLDELDELLPKTITKGLVNPAPPRQPASA